MPMSAAAVGAGWIVVIGAAVCVRSLDSSARLFSRMRWLWPAVVSTVVFSLVLSTTSELIGSALAGGVMFGVVFALQPRGLRRRHTKIPRR
jgi:hypothetical protein